LGLDTPNSGSATASDVSSAICRGESVAHLADRVQGCAAMPHVVDVLDHWIELYSADRDVTATADYLFWFGNQSPPNILVTTCLSALTLGVSADRGIVGTVGVRVA
jgi:hypothetical protein